MERDHGVVARDLTGELVERIEARDHRGLRLRGGGRRRPRGGALALGRLVARGEQRRAGDDRQGAHAHRLTFSPSARSPRRTPVPAYPGRHPVANPVAHASAHPRSSARPNTQTTVAPVGRSSVAEAAIPTTLTSVPKPQPMKRRRPIGAPESGAREGRHDEVGEDQQDARDADGTGDDHPERRIEDEVPEPDPPALAEGRLGIGRDQEEGPPAEPVEDADGPVQHGHLGHLRARRR